MKNETSAELYIFEDSALLTISTQCLPGKTPFIIFLSLQELRERLYIILVLGEGI